MKPEPKIRELTETLGYDEEDNIVFRDSKEDDWNSLKEIDMRIERFTEDKVLQVFPDALLSDGDMVYVRRIGGRLQWLKANDMGSDKKWAELTPVTAKHLEVVGDYPEILATPTEAESLAELRKKLATEEETHQIGWYQNVKGELYQFNGSEWVGSIPNKKQIAELEYLG